MEGTHPNDTRNENTRKRRSSILKSQRVSRTPFSELEFNVTTPPDTSKCRRVSFSKRTGVAEFVTNEATTTWKNFYEEQNRSHESSGHESGSHKPSIGHIGNRIFDQQFEEMEAEIDFGNTLGVPCNNVNTSVNVTEELALLDTTEDNAKITAPKTKFDLSSFTEHSKAFRSELTNPIISDMSEQIKVNFSVMNPIGKYDDDLDEIERDLKFEQSNIVGPAFGASNKSQLIELDFNTTQGLIRVDNCSDMSITETIDSPKKVSKIPSVNSAESNRSNVKDWVKDKENIVVNPYVSPVKSETFTVPAEQVLVFDGKKVQYADINADLDAIIEDSQSVISHRDMLSKTNKSLVLDGKKVQYADIDAELDAIIEDSKSVTSHRNMLQKTLSNNDNALAGMLAKTVVSARHANNTIYNDDAGADMSITTALPFKSIEQTKFYKDDGNMSITRALLTSNVDKTMIYNDDADISMTKAIPAVYIDEINIYNENSLADMSITRAVSGRNSDNTNNVNDQDIVADMSQTQVISAALISEAPIFDGITKGDVSLPNDASIKNVNKTTIYSEEADMSMTKVAPSGFINTTNIYNDEITVADVAISRPLPNMLHENRKKSLFEGEISECKAPINMSEIEKIKEGENNKSKMSIAHSIVHDLWNQQSESIENLKNINNLPLTKAALTAIKSDSNNDADLSDEVSESMSSLPKEEHLVQAESHQDEKLNERLLATLMFNEKDDDVAAKRMYPVEILESMMVREDVPTKKAIIPDSFVPKQSKIPRSGQDDNMDPSTVLNNLNAEINRSKKRIIAFENDNVTSDTSTSGGTSNYTITSDIKSEVVNKDESFANMSMTRAMPPLRKSYTYENLNHTRHEQHTLNNINETILKDTSRSVVVCQASDLSHFSVNDLVNSILHDNAQLQHSAAPLPVSIKAVLENVTADKRAPTVNVLIMNIVNPDHNKNHTPGDSDNSVMREDMPSNKGDEFHASSDKLTGAKVQLNNPHYTLHSQKAPKVLSKKKAEPAESSFEQKIKSISYDALAASSTHTDRIEEQMSIRKLSPSKLDNDSILTNEAEISNVNENTSYRKIEERLLSPRSESIRQSTKTMLAGNKSDPKREILNTLLDMSDFSLTDFCDDKDVSTSTENIQISSSFFTIGESETKLHSYPAMEGSSNSPKSSESNSAVIPFINSSQKSTAINSELSINSIQREQSLPTHPESIQERIETKDIELEGKSQESKKLSKTKKTFNGEDVAISKTEAKSSPKKQLEAKTKSERLERSLVESGGEPAINPDDTADLLEIISSLTVDQSINKKGLKLKKKINEIDIAKKTPTTKTNLSHKYKTKKNKDQNSTIDTKLEQFDETDKSLKTVSQNTSESSTAFIAIHNYTATDTNMEEENNGKVLKKIFPETKPDDTHNNKVNVIPSYMVSDGIKELMDDLVKPMADVLPYRSAVPCISNTHPSTCSVELQANINTTSQIDIELTDCESTLESSHTKERRKKIVIDTQLCTHNELIIIPNPNPLTYPEKTVVFDISNPLNNILLEPIDYNTAHNYQPIITPKENNPEMYIKAENSEESITENKDKTNEVYTVHEVKTLSPSDKDIIRNITEDKDTSSDIIDGKDASPNITKGKNTSLIITEDKHASLNITKGKTASPNITKGKNTSLIITEDKHASLNVTKGEDASPRIPKGKNISLIITEDKHATLNITEGKDASPNKTKGKNTSLIITEDKQASLNITKGKDASLNITESKDASRNIVTTEYKDASCNITADKDSSRNLTDNKNSSRNLSEHEELNRNHSPYQCTTEIGRVTLKYSFDSKTTSVKTSDSPREDIPHSTSFVFVSDPPFTDIRTSRDTEESNTPFSEIITERRVRTRKRSFSPQNTSSSEPDQSSKKNRNVKSLNKSPTLKNKEIGDLKVKGTSITNSEKEKRSHSPKSRKTPIRGILSNRTKSPPKLNPKVLSSSEEQVVKAVQKLTEDSDMHEAVNESVGHIATNTDDDADMKTELTEQNDFAAMLTNDSSIKTAINNILRLEDNQNFLTKISIEPKKENDVKEKCSKMKGLSTYSSDWLSTTPEFTSAEDITHKINQLKFLGNSIWEWERRVGDKWSFLLLRARIRLSVIFESSDVKPGTQVSVTVFEPTQKEALNHLSSLCVRFALGAMRQSAADFTRAADLPQVLLRCAGVSRLATQWLKAMWDARARLGYRIHGDEVVFKVANVPLRSVYEVSIRMSLAAHPSGLFPRAGTPHVRAVVAPGNVPRNDAAALVKALDENWGHVPKAIWRVFKLLKDKTEDAVV